MIINHSKLYDGLRPMVVSRDKLANIKINPQEDDYDTVERVLKDKYHICNPRDWMFAPDDDLFVVLFFPKLTDSKVTKIFDEIGGTENDKA